MHQCASNGTWQLVFSSEDIVNLPAARVCGDLGDGLTDVLQAVRKEAAQRETAEFGALW